MDDVEREKFKRDEVVDAVWEGDLPRSPIQTDIPLKKREIILRECPRCGSLFEVLEGLRVLPLVGLEESAGLRADLVCVPCVLRKLEKMFPVRAPSEAVLGAYRLGGHRAALEMHKTERRAPWWKRLFRRRR